jgi:hypothetical protein
MLGHPMVGIVMPGGSKVCMPAVLEQTKQLLTHECSCLLC